MNRKIKRIKREYCVYLVGWLGFRPVLFCILDCAWTQACLPTLTRCWDPWDVPITTLKRCFSSFSSFGFCQFLFCSFVPGYTLLMNISLCVVGFVCFCCSRQGLLLNRQSQTQQLSCHSPQECWENRRVPPCVRLFMLLKHNMLWVICLGLWTLASF